MRSRIGALRIFHGRGSGRTLGVIIPMVILWAVLSFASPVFLTRLNIANLLLQGATVGILAVGATVVLVVAEIDLSIGAVEGLTAVVSALLIVQHGWPWELGVVAAISVGVAVGVINGLVTVLVGVPSFITTLATLGLATGLAQKLSTGETLSGFPHSYQMIGEQTVVFGIKLPVFIALATLLVVYFVLRQTRFGLNVYAVGGNKRAASLAGIRPGRIKIAALAISGGCAGIAGVVISARLDAAASSFGSDDLLNAIAAVVIGGTALTGGVGSVVGTGFGVIIIVTIQNGLTLLNVSPLWTPAFVGAVILAAVIVHRFTRRTAPG